MIRAARFVPNFRKAKKKEESEADASEEEIIDVIGAVSDVASSQLSQASAKVAAKWVAEDEQHLLLQPEDSTLLYPLNPLRRFVDEYVYSGDHPLRKNSFVRPSREHRDHDRRKWDARRIVQAFAPVQCLRTIPIIRVGAGLHHTLLIAEDGRVFGLGMNTFGQLGTGDRENRDKPALVVGFGAPETERIEGSVVQAVGGMRFSAILCDTGQVYTFGTSRSGELGLGSLTSASCIPSLVQFPREDEDVVSTDSSPIADIAAGAFHIVATSRGGKSLYSWGRGDFGQLGLGDRVPCPAPRLIRTLRALAPIQQVSLGYAHSCMISASGDLWTWGRGRHGQLGYVNDNDQLVPKVVDELRDLLLVRVAAGSRQSIVMTDDQRIAILGTQKEDGTHRCSPVWVKTPKNEHVLDICACATTASVVCESGWSFVVDCSETYVEFGDRSGLEMQPSQLSTDTTRAEPMLPSEQTEKMFKDQIEQNLTRARKQKHKLVTNIFSSSSGKTRHRKQKILTNSVGSLADMDSMLSTHDAQLEDQRFNDNAHIEGKDHNNESVSPTHDPLMSRQSNDSHMTSDSALAAITPSNRFPIKAMAQTYPNMDSQNSFLSSTTESRRKRKNKGKMKATPIRTVAEDVMTFDNFIDELVDFKATKEGHKEQMKAIRALRGKAFDWRAIVDTSIPFYSTQVDVNKGGQQLGVQYQDHVRELTPQEIARHLFKSVTMWLGQDVDDDNEDSHKQQNEWSKLSKGAKGNSIQGDLIHEMRMLTERLKIENKRLDFMRVFDDIDEDGSGEIDKFEMQRALKQCGHNASMKTVMKVIQLYDTDGNGEISEEEFMIYAMERQQKRSMNPVADLIFKILLPAKRAVKRKEGFRLFVTIFKEHCMKRNISHRLSDTLRAKLTLPENNPDVSKGILNLSRCDIDDEILFALADTLKTIPVVRKLDLRHNRITTHGAIALLKAVQQQYDSSEFVRASLCIKCDELVQFLFPDKEKICGCSCSPPSRGGIRYFLPAYWLDSIQIVNPIRNEQRLAQAKMDLKRNLKADIVYWLKCTEEGVPDPAFNRRSTPGSQPSKASSGGAASHPVEPLLRVGDYSEADLSRPSTTTTSTSNPRTSGSRAFSAFTPLLVAEDAFSLSDVHDLISDVTEQAVTKLNADAKGILSEVAKVRMARTVFLAFDLDQSGQIDVKELKAALKNLGLKLSRSKVRAIFKQFDTDNSGLISEEEFVELVLAAFDDKNPLMQGIKAITNLAKTLGGQSKSELEQHSEELREYALNCVPEIEKIYFHKAHKELRSFVARLKLLLYRRCREKFRSIMPSSPEIIWKQLEIVGDGIQETLLTLEWTCEDIRMQEAQGVLDSFADKLKGYYSELSRQVRVVAMVHGERHAVMLSQAGVPWVRGFQDDGTSTQGTDELWGKRVYEAVMSFDFQSEVGGPRTNVRLGGTRVIDPNNDPKIISVPSSFPVMSQVLKDAMNAAKAESSRSIASNSRLSVVTPASDGGGVNTGLSADEVECETTNVHRTVANDVKKSQVHVVAEVKKEDSAVLPKLESRQSNSRGSIASQSSIGASIGILTKGSVNQLPDIAPAT